MRCSYWQAGRCRSCDLADPSYDRQLKAKVGVVAAALAGSVRAEAWLPPAASEPIAFRNKAKFCVGGNRGRLTFGLLTPPRYRGVDLTHCPLYPRQLHELARHVRTWANTLRLRPYSVRERTGELKYVLITQSPRGRFLLRLVVRSPRVLGLLASHLPELMHTAPHPIDVVSANIQPKPAAIVEGPEERILYGSRLAMDLELDPQTLLPLLLPPGAFFQTNTAVASQLYAQAVEWATLADPATAMDLYCGVGGFALALADAHRTVYGIEVTPSAIEAARASARLMEAANVTFDTGDATALALHRFTPGSLLVVNPPRRGLTTLVDWIQDACPDHIIYSSCNPTTLARDLDKLAGYTARSARLFDMFPYTLHAEVAVLLERTRT